MAKLCFCFLHVAYKCSEAEQMTTKRTRHEIIVNNKMFQTKVIPARGECPCVVL